MSKDFVYDEKIFDNTDDVLRYDESLDRDMSNKFYDAVYNYIWDFIRSEHKNEYDLDFIYELILEFDFLWEESIDTVLEEYDLEKGYSITTQILQDPKTKEYYALSVENSPYNNPDYEPNSFKKVVPYEVKITRYRDKSNDC